MCQEAKDLRMEMFSKIKMNNGSGEMSWERGLNRKENIIKNHIVLTLGQGDHSGQPRYIVITPMG